MEGPDVEGVPQRVPVAHHELVVPVVEEVILVDENVLTQEFGELRENGRIYV